MIIDVQSLLISGLTNDKRVTVGHLLDLELRGG